MAVKKQDNINRDCRSLYESKNLIEQWPRVKAFVREDKIGDDQVCAMISHPQLYVFEDRVVVARLLMEQAGRRSLR